MLITMTCSWERYTLTMTVVLILIYCVVVNEAKKKHHNEDEDEYEVEDIEKKENTENKDKPQKSDFNEEPVEAPSGVEFASFESIEDWKTNCEDCTCNPADNSNLSPVRIDTKKAIHESKLQTLMVFSDEAPKALYRLRYFWKEPTQPELKDPPMLDTLSIHNGNDEERLMEETFISGLGDPSYRFFQSALILFGNSNKTFGPDRSLHQIDEKRFPMEIVMMFSTPKYLNESSRTTQIHVMVNVTDIDNPVFHPILNSIDDMKKSYSKDTFMEKTSNVQLQFARDSLTVMLKAEKVEGIVTNRKGGKIGTGYALKMIQYYKRVNEIGDSEEIVKTSPPLIKNFEAEIADADKKIVDTEIERNKLDKERAETETLYLQKLETGEAIRGEDDEDLEKSKDLRQDVRDLITKTNELIRRRSEFTIKRDEEYDKLNLAVKKLAKYNWNFDPKISTYIPLDRISKNITVYSQRLIEIDRLKQLVAEETLKERKRSTENGEVIIKDGFQISWLLPPTGGHYEYKGSGPVPPCYERSHLIVMQNHINISNDQFDQLIQAFGTQPNSPDGYTYINSLPHDPLDISIPPIHPLGDRTVIYNPKNLQFLKDDGIHMVSMERRRIKDLLNVQDSANHNIMSLSLFFLSTLLILFVYL